MLHARFAHGGVSITFKSRGGQGFQEVMVMRRLKFVVGLIGLVIGLAVHAAPTELAGNRKPILYKVRFPTPDKHIAEVFATIPTGQRPTVELRMAVWSPGFYRVEDYARNVHDLTVIRPDGTELRVEQTKNRWLIHDAGPWATVAVSYRLTCDRKSVTQNWVSDDLIVLNGAASFVTLAGQPNWPHEVHLDLPAGCKRSITAMAPAPTDCRTTIAATTTRWSIRRSWPGTCRSTSSRSRVASTCWRMPAKSALGMARRRPATWRGWSARPIDSGASSRSGDMSSSTSSAGGGGLEHKDSTLLTSSPRGAREPGSVRWLSFVSHEYFHAFNVKRLRPVELGPFDYEHPP